MRLVLASLCLPLLLPACAAPVGRATDRIAGELVLAGTEQPIAGARLSLRAIEPLSKNADPGPRALTASTETAPAAPGPTALTASTETTPAGAFAITELAAAEPSPLLRGWAYELRADASGFYSAFARVEFTGGELWQRLEIELIDDEAMQGEQIIELPADAVDNPRGTLIDEVLRRQGRRPPGR